ncbi:MAG: R3H domain-containing nucleic acid-binding protein [Microcoleaceae cyanobacterium]
MQITDDLNKLLEVIPQEIRRQIEVHPQRDSLIEVVMDLGRRPEARFPSGAEYLSETSISEEDLNQCISQIGDFSGDNRAGIERTLHRISAIRNRTGRVIGLTCRVGRSVFGKIGMIRDLVETGESILMLGRPGVGKTTALREIARVLADELEKRVVIIDTSNEIAGDGDIPHPAIGRARRMQVARPELQHQVMVEAVENHMPEVIVIDEIGTELEALAARTIAERGVQLIGTAHGNRIENLMKNPTLADLIGGIQAVTLGDDEARRRGSQKTVLERKAPPTFGIAIEMLERDRWTVHESVANTIDSLLRGLRPLTQVRTMNDTGEVEIIQQHYPSPTETALPPGVKPPSLPSIITPLPLSGEVNGLRGSGKMIPLPQESSSKSKYSRTQADEVQSSEAQYFEQLLDASLTAGLQAVPNGASSLEFGPNGEDLPLHIYPYGIPRHQIEYVIRTLDLPVVVTKDIDSADVVLALRSHVRNQSKLKHMAKVRQVPIHTIKSGGAPQVARALRRLLKLEDPNVPEIPDLALFSQNGSSDELEALEEARLAVEQIVIPKGQPVELLPRSPQVRKMQHELVEHYRLKSNSFGEEPNRRLRIYPA